MKRPLRILVITLIIALLGWIAVRRTIHSRQVADKVAAHLQKVYGGAVKLDNVDIGIASSALNRVEFSEIDCPTRSTEKNANVPWLSVASFSTDVSAIDLLKGQASPTQVKVSGAKLFLRFSKDGKLLTCLPEQLSLDRLSSVRGQTLKIGAFPLIELEDSQVTLRAYASDEPDLVFTKVHGKIEKKKDQLVLTGSMENPQWGHWTISGAFEQDAHEVAVRFTGSAGIEVTPGMMQQLPFLPADIFRSRDMRSPLMLRVVYDLEHGTLAVRGQ